MILSETIEVLQESTNLCRVVRIGNTTSNSILSALVKVVEIVEGKLADGKVEIHFKIIWKTVEFALLVSSGVGATTNESKINESVSHVAEDDIGGGHK